MNAAEDPRLIFGLGMTIRRFNEAAARMPRKMSAAQHYKVRRARRFNEAAAGMPRKIYEFTKDADYRDKLQ